MSETPLGLRENPFLAGHDPRFIYSSRDRRETLARLREGIGTGEPFLLVTGEAGIGKTSVVSEALAGCEPPAFVASITNPLLSLGGLLEEICLRFGVGLESPRSPSQALAQLERRLRDIRSRGQVAVLVLDEAHRLEQNHFEGVRFLSNWGADGQELFYVILMGLPQLEETLGRPENGRFRQRIGAHCKLRPLSAEETERYLHHRVRVAGGSGPELFPGDACHEIHRLARGIPHEINTLAGLAMARAGGEGASAVAPAHVRAAAAEARRQNAAGDPTQGSRAGTTGSIETEVVPTHAQPTDPGAQVPFSGSRSHDPNVREWVSRFAGPGGPPQIGIRAGKRDETFLPANEDPESEPKPDVELDPPDEEPPAGEKKRRARPPRLLSLPAGAKRRHRRRRHRSRAQIQITLAVLVGVVLPAAVILLPRTKDLTSMLRGLPQMRATSSRPDVSSPDRLPAEAQDPLRGEPIAPPPPARSDTTAGGTPALGTGAPPPVTAPPPAPEKSAPPAPAERYGLEVGSFINHDRAVVERERLAEEAGLPSRISATTENDGVVTYRIVLGSFEGERAAERAADKLLRRGLVNEARVVMLAGRRAKPR